MTSHDEARRAAYLPADARAETLIIGLYRCAMAGFAIGDAESWDIGWRSLADAVPAEEAGPLFGRFYGFARALLGATRNPLPCRPATCRGLCHEETLALRMIESAQAADPLATLAAASLLLGAGDLGEVLQATQWLASSLARRELVLRPPEPDKSCVDGPWPHRRVN